MGYIGTGSIDLADLSDAIISGTRPASTEEGQLWIDTSSDLPVLMVYKNGKWIEQHLDVSKMDEGLATTVTETFETLGSITNDNLLTVNDRLVIMQEINRLIGKMVSTKDKDNYPNGLPTIEELDQVGLGSIAITRESSLRLGIEPTDPVFIDIEIAYGSLRNYFNELNTDGINIWDITEENKAFNIEIDGDIFRERWLTFYNALLLLNAEILAVPGPAGQAAITMELSNDNVTIATDNNGYGAHYGHTQTHIAIYEGTANVTHEWLIGASVSTYKDSDGVTKPEVIGSLNENGTLYTIEEVTVYTDDAYVDFTATREGYATFTKRMIISKVKTGESAINEWLSFSSSILKKDTNGIFNPQDITFEYKQRIGGGDIENQEGIIKIFEYQISSTGEVLVYDSSKDGSNGFDNKVTWKPSSPNIEYIRVELYDKQSRLLDIETVNVISDGQDAVLPVTISLDNDTIVVPSKSDGTLYPNSFNHADVTVSAYMGNGYLNLITDSSPYNLIFVPSENVTGGRYVKDGSNRWSYKVTGLSGNSGIIDIFLSEKDSGKQLAHKTITIFKNHDGASGVYQWISIPKVISISLDPNNNVIFSPTSFTVNSYQIIGDQTRELDPSINDIQLDGVQISNGSRSALMTVKNGSIVQTKELMEAIGTGVEYRDFEIQVSIPRGSVVETEFIEIIADGRHGSTGHVWIQYADNELGLNMTDNPTDKEYMGVAVSYDGVRPTESSSYTWQKTVGNTGLPGENGSMLHVKYSNDGGKTFTGNDGEDVGTYIGMYIDFIIEDSDDPSRYTWNKREPDENIIGYMSNESMTFPADEHGQVVSYIGNTGTFHVYRGIDEITTSEEVEFSIVHNPDSIVTSAIDENGIYTITNMDNSKDKRSDSVIFKATIGKVVIEKTVSVNKSLAGASGGVGDDALNGHLTNEHHTIYTDSNGDKGNYIGAATRFVVYEGTKEVTSSWTVTIDESSGITGEFDYNTHTYTLSGIAEDSASVIFTASKSGHEPIEKVFTINRVKQARDGQSAITYTLGLSTVYFRRDTDNVITPTSTILEGKKVVGNEKPSLIEGYFVIYEQPLESITIDNFTDLAYRSLVDIEQEYIISNIDFPYVKRYQSLSPESTINYTPTSNTMKSHIEWYSDPELTNLLDYEQIMVIPDGKDVYKVELHSTNGNTFKNGVIDTWIYAVVYRGDTDITSEINEGRFQWERTSMDIEGDKLWNQRYYGGTKEIKITTDDVYKRATFTCSIRKE